MKEKSSWKRIMENIIFDKAVWLFAALCVLGFSYWKQSNYVYHEPLEFSMLQLTHDTKIDIAIMEIANNLLFETKSDRVYIMQFHNGAELAGGNAFKKTSCLYETVSPGTSRILKDMQNIPLSAIPECINQMLSTQSSFILVASELKFGTHKALLEKFGTHTAVDKMLQIKGKALGYLCVNYVRSDYVSGTNAQVNVNKVLQDVNNAAELIQLELEKK